MTTRHPEVLNTAFWQAFLTGQRQRVWKNRVTGEWDTHTIYEPVRTTTRHENQ